MREIRVGEVFGRLTVVGFIPSGKNMKLRCRCECGGECTPQRGSLLRGASQSCGCLARERRNAANTTHGGTGRQEFRIFQGMKARCNSPKNKAYPNYGGRGIRVLYTDFAEFIADVGPRPPGGCVERKDTNGHYEPGNCEWATRRQNNLNLRTSRRWIIDGRVYESLQEAANAIGVSKPTIHNGCNGWTSRSGKVYPPRPGWRSEPKYPDAATPLSEAV